MSEVYHCIYTLSGLTAKQYKELNRKLKDKGILFIERTAECTLKKSYLANDSIFIWLWFTYILDFLLGRG